MERNREGRRAAVAAVPSANRRPRAKDVSDDEDRLDDVMDSRGDSRVWERPKKEKLATFQVSVASNPRNKRKRPLLRHESPGMGRPGLASEDADESVEETEGGASDDDDEPPPPLRKPLKARAPAKEDEVVRDIPAVPRKARSSISSSSRFSSMAKRQTEPHSVDMPQQKPPISMLNGTSSPGFLQKHTKKLKAVGAKVRPLKVPKMSEPSTISDQEVEVAEALFVLARSMPMHSRTTESKPDVKLEVEAGVDSPSAPTSTLAGPSSASHLAGNITNGYVSSHLKDTPPPVAEAPKRKRPRVIVKQEDGRVSTVATHVRVVASGAASSACMPTQSPAGQVEPDPVSQKSHLQGADVHGAPTALLKAKASTEAMASALSQEDGLERKVEPSDRESIEQGEFEAPKEETECNSVEAEEDSGQYEKSKSPLTVEGVAGNDGSTRQELLTRSFDGRCDDRGTSKLNIDLMVSPIKHSSHEDEGHRVVIEKPVVEDDTSMNSIGYNVEVHAERESKQGLVLEGGIKAMEVNSGLLTHKEEADEEEHHSKLDSGRQKLFDHQQKEQLASQFFNEEKEDEDRVGESEPPKVVTRPLKDETDNCVDSSAVPTVMSTAGSSSAPSLAGWMGGLPQLGYYAPGVPPWAAGASLSTPSLDAKAVHAAMQLPHGALLAPVPRMKRCSTHVYMAHFIYREQQLSRHSMWSAALCRAAPYNLNIPPAAGIIDNEKLGHFMEATRKASTQQSGPSYGHTVSQAGGGPGLAGSSSTHGGGPTVAISAPNHTNGVGSVADGGTGSANANVMAAHNPYIQAMIQHNGFASFPFPFSGPPGQGAQFFNNPFFAPHMMPPLPHMQPSSNVLPVQKQQPGPAPTQQQPLQLQLAPQSPSQSQQQQLNHGGSTAQHYAVHSEKENTVRSESLSTAESRLSAMQRTIGGQGPASLPNLNTTPALMLGTNIGAMSTLDQDVSSATSGLKQAGGKTPYQGQSSSSSLQQQSFMTQAASSAPGMQMKALDTTLPQGYSALASNRLPSGPGALGLASVSSMMGGSQVQGHGGLPGPSDTNKGLLQQQPSYGGGNHQQFQSSVTKGPPVSEDSYVAKGRDYPEDKMSMRQVGVPPLLSRVEMEASSSSLQGSPISGSGSQSARLAGNLGRTLNTTPSPGSRPASTVGAGQAAPLMQNQPPKQGMGRMKPAGGVNVAPSAGGQSMAPYAGRVLPGNLGKFAGSVLPFSGQMAPTSQGLKPNPAGLVKVGQRTSPGQQIQQQVPPPTMVVKGQVQPTRSNQQGAPSMPGHMLSAVSTPLLPTGTISMSTSHSQSAPKGQVVAVSKNISNVKGATPAVKPGPAAKKPSVSASSMSSALSSQAMSVRPPSQQKNQSVVHVSQFTQQQPSYAGNQQKVGAKNQAYPQLQQQQGQYKPPFPQQAPTFQQQQGQYKPPFLQQPSTYQQQSEYRPQLFIQQQQNPNYLLNKDQVLPPNAMVPSHHLTSTVQSLPAQHVPTPPNLQTNSQLSQLQQQFQPGASLQAQVANNGIPLSSANLTVGTAAAGNMGVSASSDGALRPSNPPKAAYTTGNPLPSAGMPESMTSAHTSVGGQVGSPHSSSSHYVQLASPAKPTEQKSSHDSGNREEMNSARHHTLTASQAGLASNPTTT